jgi:hypothetical protein
MPSQTQGTATSYRHLPRFVAEAVTSNSPVFPTVSRRFTVIYYYHDTENHFWKGAGMRRLASVLVGLLIGAIITGCAYLYGKSKKRYCQAKGLCGE